MKLKFKINNTFINLDIDDKDIKEQTDKRDCIEPDKKLEIFILEDIRNLVQNEIEDGKYKLFNY